MIATTPTPPTIRPTLDSASMTRKKPPVMLVERLQDLVLGDDGEVVLLRRLEPALGAQRRDDLVLRLHDGRALGRHHGDVHPALPVVRHLGEGGMRDGRGAAGRRRRRASGLGVHADHLEGLAEDLDALADRVEPGEERLGQLVVDDRDVGARRVLRASVKFRPGQDLAARSPAPSWRANPAMSTLLRFTSLVAHRPARCPRRRRRRWIGRAAAGSARLPPTVSHGFRRQGDSSSEPSEMLRPP